MKKYTTVIESYNPFTGSKYEHVDLGSNAIKAYSEYIRLCKKDYDYGEGTGGYQDSYRKTHRPIVTEVFEKPVNSHNLFTPQRQRLNRWTVYYFDGTVEGTFVASDDEVSLNIGKLLESGYDIHFNNKTLTVSNPWCQVIDPFEVDESIDDLPF